MVVRKFDPNRPFIQWNPREGIAFIMNEGGRFCTFSVYREPLAVRLYLGADFKRLGSRAPRRAWMLWGA